MSLLFAIILSHGQIKTIYLQNLGSEKECKQILHTMQTKYNLQSDFVGGCLKGLTK